MKIWISIVLFYCALSLAKLEAKDSIDVNNERLLSTYLDQRPLWTWPWNWGTGILLFGLERFAEVADQPAIFREPLERFHRLHSAGPWRVQWSDQCAPALSALSLELKGEFQTMQPSVNKVVKYLKESRRNKLGSLDHFSPGSPAAWFFPSSIWLDSLMMWGVFALHYGQQYDAELYDFALEQAELFRKTLWDQKEQLFYHAWNLELDRPYPEQNTFWLRGNGWVAVYLVEALSVLDPNDPRFFELLALYQSFAKSLLQSQRADGLWGTLIREPELAYPESSGSALIAFSFAKGHRLGLLGAEYAESARHTWLGLQSQLRSSAERLYLGQISLGTNPGTREDYLKIRVSENINYGLGAFFLLAAEMKQ